MGVIPGVLDVFRSRRVLLMLLFGFASGLPYQLTGTTLSARLSGAGVPLATIGLFALVGLPYSLKFAWAPLLDRYAPPLLGRRRGWVLLFQLALIAAIAALGAAEPAAAPRQAAGLALAVALLSASQDVVSDAYRTDLLHPAERAAGTATYILGYRAAMLLSGGLALVLADHLSFGAVYGLMALAMLAGVLATLRAPEPPRAEPPRSLRSAVLDPFADYFRRRGALPLLLFVTLYRAGDLAANVMVTPFLLSLHFSRSEVGVVYKIAGTAATIVGALGGGAAVARFGLYRSLFAFALLQGVANLGYGALALAGRGRALLFVAVGADHLCTGLAIAALDAFLMALCNRRFSATQFALLASASGAAGRLFGAGAGYLAGAVGWPLFFVGTMGLAAPALLLLRHLRGAVIAADRGPAP